MDGRIGEKCHEKEREEEMNHWDGRETNKCRCNGAMQWCYAMGKGRKRVRGEEPGFPASPAAPFRPRGPGNPKVEKRERVVTKSRVE